MSLSRITNFGIGPESDSCNCGGTSHCAVDSCSKPYVGSPNFTIQSCVNRSMRPTFTAFSPSQQTQLMRTFSRPMTPLGSQKQRSADVVNRPVPAYGIGIL